MAAFSFYILIWKKIKSNIQFTEKTYNCVNKCKWKWGEILCTDGFASLDYMTSLNSSTEGKTLWPVMEAHVRYHWQGSWLCCSWKHFHSVNTKIYAERSKRINNESKRVTWGIDNALQWDASIWHNTCSIMVRLQERFWIIGGCVVLVDERKLKAEKLNLKVLPWEKLAFEKHNLQKFFRF